MRLLQDAKQAWSEYGAYRASSNATRANGKTVLALRQMQLAGAPGEVTNSAEDCHLPCHVLQPNRRLVLLSSSSGCSACYLIGTVLCISRILEHHAVGVFSCQGCCKSDGDADCRLPGYSA